ncbi:hypothetical protein CHELA20_11569 [Hyphomicrobiales bacterium]|jgi:hypothetical protein|nr:hypothetical protein CHELA20_11569 [Hyphomicrobiales bacterium]CAH1689048.1 hypothetical protein CHELA41_50022 [Hyphomicrobiales bacterium]
MAGLIILAIPIYWGAFPVGITVNKLVMPVVSPWQCLNID